MTSKDPLHRRSKNSEIVLERIRHLPIGGRMKDIPEHLWHDSFIRVGDKKTGGPNLRLLRLDPEKPSNTVTAYIFNKFVHPKSDRYITPREAARIQQFPDSHDFAGPITAVQLQIGNAVPVGLAKAVAEHIAGFYDGKSKPKALSLFSGAGGMDLGFEEFFNVKAAIEFEKFSCQTLRNNFPDLKVIEGDIREVTKDTLGIEGLDFIFGGPPCQPFSAAGKQKGVKDPRGLLVDEYIRLVTELQPKYFVLENVQGLVYNQKGGALAYILEAAENAGYETEWKVLNAANYGVPQSRMRLFVIGRAKGLPATGFPEPTHIDVSGQLDLFLQPFKTVGEALEGLGEPTAE